MKLINKITGQILKLESGQIFGEIAESKNAATQPYNIAIAIDDATINGLLVGNLPDWEPFEDVWAFETKYRYFASDAEIGAVAKADPTTYNVLAQLRRMDFENGTELYFDEIESDFEKYINLSKLEERIS